MKLDALVFDLYGTLVDFGALRDDAYRHTPDATSFVDAWRAKQLQYAFLATMMERYVDFEAITGVALDFACAQFNVVLDADERERMVSAWSRLPAFGDVPRVLDALRERGIPLAVLSNGAPSAIERTLAGARIADRFDAVLSVDAVRAYKPRPQVYDLAVQRFGLPRDAIGFVSSNGWDATGAAEFGFTVFWCNRRGLPAETFGAKPHATVRSLEALLAEPLVAGARGA